VLPPRAPFDLFFHDGGHWRRDPDPLPIELLARGGVLVLDDMTPSRSVEPDPVRELVLGHPGLVATELLTTAETSAIVATRR
jgi:hypothetical protein